MRILMISAAVSGLCLAALVASAAAGKSKSADKLIKKLGDKKTAEAAVVEIAEYAGTGDDQRAATVGALKNLILQSADFPERGWAVLALAEIGGQDVDELLLEIHSDDSQEMLVRTWAAAARVKMSKSTAALIEKAALVAQFPALGRPIGMRLVERLASDGGDDVSPEGVLAVSLQVPALQQALVPVILAMGPEKLSQVLISAKNQEVRRQAAAYLGTMAGQGENQVTRHVTRVYLFDVEAGDVPWSGGPLFLPGLSWEKEDAKALVGNLIRWYLWCDRHGRSAETTQVHNNIRSVGLANVVGYQSPAWEDPGVVPWLTAWGKAVGRDELETILKEQGVLKDPKYAAALKPLG